MFDADVQQADVQERRREQLVVAVLVVDVRTGTAATPEQRGAGRIGQAAAALEGRWPGRPATLSATIVIVT